MPEFKCDACGTPLPTKEALMQHAANSHGQARAAQTFRCEACAVGFSSQAELQAHAKSAHAM